MSGLRSYTVTRPAPWVRGKRRREAWVALLAHSLDLMVNGTGGVGSEKAHNFRSAERAAKHLLDEPEIARIRRSFNHVALADVKHDLDNTIVALSADGTADA